MNDDDLDALAPLVRAVGAPPTSEELRGEAAILAAYRTSTARNRSLHGGLRLVSSTGMTVAAGALVLSMTGVTAAAYTSALPHGVQRAAHRLFHRIGVPAPPPDRAASDDLTTATRPLDLRTAGPTPVPRRAAERRGLWAVLQGPAVVPAGTTVRVDLRMPATAVVSGQTATLLGRTPGTASWTAVARVRVSPLGTATATVPRLAHALLVRWSLPVPHGANRLGPVTEVFVRPALTTSLSTASAAQGRTVVLSVTSEPAQQGRPVRLQQLLSGRWVDLGRAMIDARGHAAFRLDTSRTGTSTYRCVLAPDVLFAGATTTPLTLSVR